MTSFPLIRLPNLAREQVIREMDIREQYFFSTLSKIARRATKISIRHVLYSLDVELKPDETHWKIKKDVINSDEFYIVFDMSEGLIRTLEFFIDQFKHSSFVLTCLYVPHAFVQQFLETSRISRIKIDRLSITSDDPDEKLFEYIKENSFELDYCHLSCSPWVSLNKLTSLFMDCRYFKTTDSEHQIKSHEDFNRFVKLWMENDSKLEFVGIDANEFIDMRVVLAGIEKEMMETAYIEEAEETFNAGDAFKIRQKSGKEAVVCNSQWQFTLTTNFHHEEEWEDEEEEVIEVENEQIEVEDGFNED